MQNLVLTDFSSFPKDIKVMKGAHFAIYVAMKKACKVVLNSFLEMLPVMEKSKGKCFKTQRLY